MNLNSIRQSDQEALKQSSDMRREEYNFLNLIDDMFFYKNQVLLNYIHSIFWEIKWKFIEKWEYAKPSRHSWI